MRVAFITHYTRLYGANKSLVDLIAGLKAYNVESYVVAPSEGEVVEELKVRQVPVLVLPIKKWVWDYEGNNSERILKILTFPIKALARAVLNFILLFKLVTEFKKWKIDVVYTNSSVIAIGFFAAKMLKISHVWHLRELGTLHFKHHPDCGYLLFKKIIFKSDGIIAVSKSVYQEFFAKSHKNAAIIYNGVASKELIDDIYQQGKSRRLFKSAPVFIVIGRLYVNKGQETAIKAVAEVKKHYPDIKLLVAGDGEENYLNELKTLASKLNIIESVSFLGRVNNPSHYLQEADCLLMCSRNEAMGRVTVESMLAGRPVIGINSGATPELIIDGVTGIITEDDVLSVANGMRLLIENPKLAQEISENAFNEAKNKYSIEECSENIYQVLKDLRQKN